MRGVAVLCFLASLSTVSSRLAPHYLSVGTGIGMPSAVKDKYHTTDSILAQISDLEGKCKVLTKHEVQVTDPGTNLMRSTYAYTLTDPDSPKEGKKRFMLTFGMHGREYISSETALHLSHFACETMSVPSAETHDDGHGGKTGALSVSAAAREEDGKAMAGTAAVEVKDGVAQMLMQTESSSTGSAPMDRNRLSSILKTTEILYIPVLNIDGRKKLEAGDSCTAQRKNGRNVDINRNFADWYNPGNAAPQDEDYQGPAAMSEWETNVVKVVAGKFKPHAFVDIHSGDLGMGYVYGHSGSEKSPDEAVNKLWTSSIQQEVFKGKVWTGNLANMGSYPYESHGSSCDYMYKSQQTRIAGTWEIWRKPSFFASASAQHTGSTNALSISSNNQPADGSNYDYVSTTTTSIPTVKEGKLSKLINDPNALQIEPAAQLESRDSIQTLMQASLGSSEFSEPLGLGLGDVQTLVQSMKSEGKEHMEIENLLQDMSREQCFAYFNPVMPEHYDDTVKGFTTAILVGAEKLSTPEVVAMFK